MSFGEIIMQNNLVRYSQINEKMPREAILIQGKGCIWKKCVFCDYYLDVSDNPFEINVPAINSITGKFGVLDVSNSGSAMEIDKHTLELLIKKTKEKNIHTIWFEARWNYRHQLNEFRKNFPHSTVKFRMGVETFNPKLRNLWKKGIPDNILPQDIAKYYNGVSLMVGLDGQNISDVQKDIEIANSLFEYFSLNVFTENTTNQLPNKPLIEEFVTKIYPLVNKNPKADILIQNTDWGIG